MAVAVHQRVAPIELAAACRLLTSNALVETRGSAALAAHTCSHRQNMCFESSTQRPIAPRQLCRITRPRSEINAHVAHEGVKNASAPHQTPTCSTPGARCMAAGAAPSGAARSSAPSVSSTRCSVSSVAAASRPARLDTCCKGQGDSTGECRLAGGGGGAAAAPGALERQTSHPRSTLWQAGAWQAAGQGKSSRRAPAREPGAHQLRHQWRQLLIRCAVSQGSERPAGADFDGGGQRRGDACRAAWQTGRV